LLALASFLAATHPPSLRLLNLGQAAALNTAVVQSRKGKSGMNGAAISAQCMGMLKCCVQVQSILQSI